MLQKHEKYSVFNESKFKFYLIYLSRYHQIIFLMRLWIFQKILTNPKLFRNRLKNNFLYELVCQNIRRLF